MEKKWTFSRVLGIACYTIGILCAIYVGGWLMFIKPIQTLVLAFSAGTLSLSILLKSIIKIAFSSTFAGLVFCIGYIGYNHFKGTEDPDWQAIEEKWKLKKDQLGSKIKETTHDPKDA